MQAMMWIIRHASAGPTTDAKDDDERPLDDLGVAQAKAAGVALRKLKTPIQACLSSPLTRCMQTSDLVCVELGLKPISEVSLAGPPLPNHDLRRLVRGMGNVLLCTHSPSCNLITYRLTGAQVQLAKGGLVQIHEGEVWSLLNPSACEVMAGVAKFGDPQEVDIRSADPPLEERMRERSPDWYVPRTALRRVTPG